MRSSNIGKLISAAAFFIALVILLEAGIRFLYEDYRSYHIYARKEYKEELGQLDTLFCGTSRTYSGINPMLFDELTGSNSFHLATSAQGLDSTYFLIKDALRVNPVKKIYLELSVATLFENDDDYARIIAADRLYTLRGRLEAAFAEENPGLQFQYLFYSTQVKDYLDFDLVALNLRYKLSARGHLAPRRVPDRIHYIGRGFYNSTEVYDGNFNGRIKERYVWDRSKISPENLSYLDKILRLCQKHEVEVILYSPPISQPVMPYVGDLTDMHEYYQAIADSYGIEFIDITALPDSLTYFPNETFRDSMHLNVDGAEVLTKILAGEYCR